MESLNHKATRIAALTTLSFFVGLSGLCQTVSAASSSHQLPHNENAAQRIFQMITASKSRAQVTLELKLAMRGYSDAQIEDILYGGKTVAGFERRLKLAMIGFDPDEVKYLYAQWLAQFAQTDPGSLEIRRSHGKNPLGNVHYPEF